MRARVSRVRMLVCLFSNPLQRLLLKLQGFLVLLVFLQLCKSELFFYRKTIYIYCSFSLLGQFSILCCAVSLLKNDISPTMYRGHSTPLWIHKGVL